MVNLNETLDQHKKNMSTRITPVKRLLVLLVWIVVFAGIIMTFQRGWEIGMGMLTTAGVASLVVGNDSTS